MGPILSVLIFFYQTVVVLSSCNVSYCKSCQDTVCSQCFEGYYLQQNECDTCHLYCDNCGGSECYRCANSSCPKDMCAYSNCSSADCLKSADRLCSSCPDGYYIGGNGFCYRCYNNNCLCSSAGNCIGCIPGKYGLNLSCQHPCPEECETCIDSVNCTKCVNGKFGTSCQGNCTQACQDGICEKSSGNCTRGCASNAFLEDGTCKECPNRCKSCVDETNCTVCQKPFNWGEACEYDCTGCYNNCSRTNGCYLGCDASDYYHTYNDNEQGYKCIHCPAKCKACTSNLSCTRCSAGFHGITCETNCSSHCTVNSQGNVECEKHNGYCLSDCEFGYWSETCTETCPEGCIDKLCNKTSGFCLGGCVDNFFGDQCDKECSLNCQNTSERSCDQRSGSCLAGCMNGFYGSNCTLLCDETCFQRKCFQENGTCEIDCTEGSTDPYCTTDTTTKHQLITIRTDTQSTVLTQQLTTPGQQMSSSEGPLDQQLTSSERQDTTASTETLSTTNAQQKTSSGHSLDAVSANNNGGIAIPVVSAAGVVCLIIGIIVVAVCLQKRRRISSAKEQTLDGTSLQTIHDRDTNADDAYVTINDTNLKAAPDSRLQDAIEVSRDKSATIHTSLPVDQVQSNEESLKVLNKQTNNAVEGGHGCDTSGNGNIVRYSCVPKAQYCVTNEKKVGDKNLQRVIAGREHSSQDSRKMTKTIMLENQKADDEADENDKSKQEHNTTDDFQEEGCAYYNTLGKRVQASALAGYIQNRDQDSFENEFHKLPYGLLKDHKVAKRPCNVAKNKYRQIYPYDVSRVVLKDGKNDYVNASYITGFSHPKEYIASAGPFARKDKVETTTDFWRMIWQEKCETIVMLTKCAENTEQKCDKYWPELGEDRFFGKLRVNCVTEDQYADFTIRSFLATQDETTINTRQIHFTAWPDKGVPTDVTCMIEYRQRVRSLHKGKTSPILIHCSAGIGRTGTFIALDIQTFVGETKGYVDIFGCVSNLRQQRVNLVQTPEQYEYLHYAILHALTFDCKSIPAEEFITYYSRIIKQKDGSSQSEHQFKNLTSTLDALSVEEKDAISRNKALKDKNRDGADIPGDENRFRLLEDRKPGSSDYINAVFINGFKTCNRFIVAQTPMPTTVVDFLSMIRQTDCSCVVMMEETNLQDKIVGCFWPADNQVIKHGIFQVRCNESKTNENYTLKKLTLVRRTGKKDEAKDVKLFIFTNWPRDTAVPKSSDSLIQLIKDVDKANSHDEDERPIIVHCMTGAGRSCLYTAVSVLIEKMEIEHEVSVVNTLRQIKSRRRAAFPTLDQYKFCHQAVISYLQTFDTYSNFELKSQSSNEAAADAVYATVKK